MANFTPNQNDYKNLTPFKTWLLLQINTWGQNNFPFVESDFDELTNYGMMQKLMKALNDVISNENMVEEDMIALYNAFTELQTYIFDEFADYKEQVDGEIENFETSVTGRVDSLETFMNNYFDNLDVQEEINNKLDAMVEAGTLQEIVADYLNSKAVFGFDNVASMQSSTNLIDGSYAKTLGYYAKNDGGGSLYKIRTITNDDVIDDKFIIEIGDSSNELIAELIYKNNQLNLLQVGGKASDNTIDNGAIINYILNKDINLYIPRGTFTIVTTINPKSYSNLTCDGTLTYDGSGNCLYINKSNCNLYINKIICNSTGIPVLLENNDNTTTCLYNKIIIDYIESNNHGLYLHAIKKGIVYNTITFKDIKAGSEYYGIYIKTEYTTDRSYVNENIIQNGRISRGLYGIYIDTDIYTNYNEVNGMHFDSIVLEGVTNGVYMNNARNNVFNYLRIPEISSSNKAFVLEGLCDGNEINSDFAFHYNNIDISNLSLTTNDATFNYFNGYITDGTGGRIGRNFITFKHQLCIRELLHKFLWTQIFESALDTNKEYHFPNTRVGNYIRFQTTSADAKIYLNQYYGSVGLNELYVSCVHGYPFALYDINGNLITSWDGTGTSEIRHFICRYTGPNDYSETWSKV